MKKILYVLLSSMVLLLYSASESSSSNTNKSSKQPLWNERLDLNQIEYRLQNQNIVTIIPIKDYLLSQGVTGPISMRHTVYLAIMEDGLKAVFKPNKVVYNTYAEVAAYRASKWLGLRLVPPTVFKTYKELQGSLQFFVESSKSRDTTAYKKLSIKDLSDMCLFYFILGKWDSNLGNQIITLHNGKAHLALIDNSSIKYKQHIQYGSEPFIYLGSKANKKNPPSTPFPFKKAITLVKPKLEEMKKVFREFITIKKIEHLLVKNRRQITYCIWNDDLWIKKKLNLVNHLQHFTNKPNYTTIYYRSTLNSYKALTKEVLKTIWQEALVQDKQYFSELIDAILDRRDQVIKSAAQKNAIMRS